MVLSTCSSAPGVADGVGLNMWKVSYILQVAVITPALMGHIISSALYSKKIIHISKRLFCTMRSGNDNTNTTGSSSDDEHVGMEILLQVLLVLEGINSTVLGYGKVLFVYSNTANYEAYRSANEMAFMTGFVLWTYHALLFSISTARVGRKVIYGVKTVCGTETRLLTQIPSSIIGLAATTCSCSSWLIVILPVTSVHSGASAAFYLIGVVVASHCGLVVVSLCLGCCCYNCCHACCCSCWIDYVFLKPDELGTSKQTSQPPQNLEISNRL